MARPPTCIGVVRPSRYRNDTSSDDSRSLITLRLVASALIAVVRASLTGARAMLTQHVSQSRTAITRIYRLARPERPSGAPNSAVRRRPARHRAASSAVAWRSALRGRTSPSGLAGREGGVERGRVVGQQRSGDPTGEPVERGRQLGDRVAGDDALTHPVQHHPGRRASPRRRELRTTREPVAACRSGRPRRPRSPRRRRRARRAWRRCAAAPASRRTAPRRSPG